MTYSYVGILQLYFECRLLKSLVSILLKLLYVIFIHFFFQLSPVVVPIKCHAHWGLE